MHEGLQLGLTLMTSKHKRIMHDEHNDEDEEEVELVLKLL